MHVFSRYCQMYLQQEVAVVNQAVAVVNQAVNQSVHVCVCVCVTEKVF